MTSWSVGEPTHGEVVVYRSSDGQVEVDVTLDRETVWLTPGQIAELFGRERSVISKHIRNAFQEKELDPKSTCAKYAQVQTEGGRTVTREVDHYNLDVIISVGYRVKSRRGTQFRIWATRTLRDHLLRGFTFNERRLRERGLTEIEQAIGLMARTLTKHALITGEGEAILTVVQQYTRAWRLLLEFDEERLALEPAPPVAPTAALSLEEARAAIARLRANLSERHEAGALFGQEQGEGLARILGAIEQTFDGKPLYASAQSRAAHLLYFVIKDHPFGDGNKRIGSLIFLEYLRRCGLLMRADGSPRLGDNAMVALALLIAESEPRQKDLIVRLVINLLADERP